MAHQFTLITGASGGIGYELARVFAGQGHHLILVARSQDKLYNIAGEINTRYAVDCHVFSADLSRPEAPAQLRQSIHKAGLEVEILVNNAGFATYGPFAEMDIGRELQMIQLNVAALTHLTHLFLPEMLERGYGRIMNLASTAAFQPGPLMAVYYASKAFVLSFSEALANELQNSGVSVLALCPGPTASGFQKQAGMEDSKLVQGQPIMDAATVAQIGYEALMAGKTISIPGWRNQMLALAPRFLPRNLVTHTVRQMQDSTDSEPGGG